MPNDFISIKPVILSGGSGTRLWPLSRTTLPKQLLPLVSEQSMLQETLVRVFGWENAVSPVVVCGNDHRFLVAEQLRQLEVSQFSILLEPVARNTAAAIASAAYHALKTDPDALMLVLPADHVILDVKAFQYAVNVAKVAAQAGRLVTFGIEPSTPETGYGYIKKSKGLEFAPGCFDVEKFVEKPNSDLAKKYVDSKEYYWNSGMFLFQPAVYLQELTQFQPAIAEYAKQAYENSYRDLDFCRLEEETFKQCPSNSIDYAVMEKTKLATVVPVSMGWSDVGSWSALWEVQDKDDCGNAIKGDVFITDVKNTMIRSDSRFVAAIGVKDLIIVETSDAVLVADKSQAQEVKQVVDYLSKNARHEHQVHSRVYRPWGWYESIDAGDRFQVKRIMVKPGAKLSLQMHHHRAEHWVIVSGTAIVTRDDVSEVYSENQSTYIPIGTTHRLENPGKLPLHLIEVQSGSYLGEDDIVRLDDTYGRL